MKRQYREPSESTKLKMSAKKQGVNNPNYGKVMPDEVKRKIREKLKAYWASIPSKNNSQNTEVQS